MYHLFIEECFVRDSNIMPYFPIQGIHPTIRGEVWEFLLGCYDPLSTFEEREQIRQSRR